MVRVGARQGGLLFLVLAGAGCSRGGPVPVQGTVKLDGQPLAGVSILFMAQDPAGRNATGFTGADGVFRLSTFDREDGALPGQYKVVVQPPAPAGNDPPTATPDEAQRAATGDSRPPQASVTIPPRYTRPELTILVQQVPPTGQVVFALESK